MNKGELILYIGIACCFTTILVAYAFILFGLSLVVVGLMLILADQPSKSQALGGREIKTQQEAAQA